MKKKKIILIGAAVAAVVGKSEIGAWTLFGRKSSDGSTENVVYVNSVDNLMNPGSGNGAVKSLCRCGRNTETGGHSAESG